MDTKDIQLYNSWQNNVCRERESCRLYKARFMVSLNKTRTNSAWSKPTPPSQMLTSKHNDLIPYLSKTGIWNLPSYNSSHKTLSWIALCNVAAGVWGRDMAASDGGGRLQIRRVQHTPHLSRQSDDKPGNSLRNDHRRGCNHGPFHTVLWPVFRTLL